jgi:hypothetical protein
MISAMAVTAFIVALLAVLIVRNRRHTPISATDLNRRLTDVQDFDLVETPEQVVRREASLDAILKEGREPDAYSILVMHSWYAARFASRHELTEAYSRSARRAKRALAVAVAARAVSGVAAFVEALGAAAGAIRGGRSRFGPRDSSHWLGWSFRTLPHRPVETSENPFEGS